MDQKRRKYLSLIGVAVTGTIAGCSDDSGAEGESEPTDTGGGGADETTEEPGDTETSGGDDPSDSEYVDEVDGQVTLAYGETASVSIGIDVTAHGISIYEQMGDEQPEERDVFAVLQVSTENTSDEQTPLPDATGGWELFYGDQQVGQSFNIAALEAEGYSQLEGGDVQGGVTREGAILFEVVEGFGSDEIDTLWHDNFQFVGEAGQTINVRWTANP